MYDVAAIGELLIDFTQNGTSGQGNGLFEANPGGAPCNVLAMLQKLGKKTAFLGKVGRDPFGALLSERAAAAGIDVCGLVMDAAVPTTLAFVHTMPDGDRDFSFYRSPGADMMLTEQEVSLAITEQTRMLHFGTVSMTGEPVRSATQKAIVSAKGKGALLSFDPNLRPPLWDSLDEAKAQMAYGLSRCDILKVSEEELAFFTGEETIFQGMDRLQEQYSIPLVTVTMGKKGSMAFYKGESLYQPPFETPDTIETTGAGDTFCACVLSTVLDCGLDGLTPDVLRTMLLFANAAASLITTRRGALCVMPERQEVEAYIRSAKA